MSPKIATHASAILSQSAIGKRRASNELSTNANAPANHSDWTTVSPFIAGPPTRHSPVRPLSAIRTQGLRSEEHTSELQSLMRISYAVFCLKKTKKHKKFANNTRSHQ